MGAGALRQRLDGGVGAGDGPEQLADPVRGDVAGRDPYVGADERRRGLWDLDVARRRHDVEAPRRERAPEGARGQDRPRHDQGELAADLRADRDGRQHPHAEHPPARERTALSLGRWRRDVARGELRPADDGPHALLLAHGGDARQPGRGLLPRLQLEQDARRWQDDHRPAVCRDRRRRSPRHLDRPDERPADDREPRRWRLRHEQSRQDVAAHAAPDRADVPRHHRQPDSIHGVRQPSGWAECVRAEQFAQRLVRWAAGGGGDHARAVALRGRR